MKTMKSYFVRIPAFYFILLSSLFSIVFNAQSTQGFSNSFFTNNLQLSPLKTDISSCSLRHFRQRWRHSSTKLWLSQENPVYKKGGYEKGSSRNSTEATKSRASSFQNSNTTSATPLTISGTYSNDSSSLMMDGATQVGILSSEERERLLKEVEELRERARQLRAEANREEAALTESRSSLKSQKNSEADDIIDRLFHNVGLTSADSTIAATVEKRISDIMRTERWSPEQVVMVLERLHERQMQVQDQPPIMTPSQAAVNRPADFQIGDTRNAAKAANETEWNVLDGCISSLINAASVLDDEYNDRANAIKGSGGTQMPPDKILQVNTSWTGRVASELKARRKELIRAEQEELKRKIAANVNAVVNAGNAAADATGIAAAENIQEYTRQSLALGSYEDEKQVGKPKKELNISRVMERVAMVPLWVPTPLLPYLVSSKATLRKEDVTTIKEKVLVGSRFFCTSSDAIPSAAIFRGNIRTSVGLVDVDTSTRTQSQERNRTAVVFEEIQQRLEAQGLSDRIQLFMMEDPEWRPGKDSRTPKAPAVILAIAKAVQPTETVMEKTTTSVVAKVRQNS